MPQCRAHPEPSLGRQGQKKASANFEKKKEEVIYTYTRISTPICPNQLPLSYGKARSTFIHTYRPFFNKMTTYLFWMDVMQDCEIVFQAMAHDYAVFHNALDLFLYFFKCWS